MMNEKTENKKKILIILATILVIALIAGIVIWLVTKNGKDADGKEGKGVDVTNIEEVKQYLKANWDKFNIDGSTSMIPLHQSLNELFSSKEEQVEHSKTVDAFEKFIKGDNDILLGVTYNDELLEKAVTSGVSLVQKEITREGFVFLVNKGNSVKNLTEEQIKDIYSGKITNWKDVGGANVPIKAYQRNDDSGSQIRMNKFMGDKKLVDKTYVAGGMGELVLEIAGFNNAWAVEESNYAIGYNMYTFTEKQYLNEDVILLSVNGVQPNDDTIFDESYPIIIYNYIYYDENNKEASEFADNLYRYLMSDEGQQLISDSGYVNLNKKYDRNKDIDFTDDDDDSLSYYNEEKGEFYDIDSEGKLLVFKNYPDFVLRKSKYKNNQKAREFITKLFNSKIITSNIIADDRNGTIPLVGYWFDASHDPEDLFNIRYNNLYYHSFTYLIEEEKILLEAAEEDELVDEEYLEGYPIDSMASSDLKIASSELKNIFIRSADNEYGIEFKNFEYFKIK